MPRQREEQLNTPVACKCVFRVVSSAPTKMHFLFWHAFHHSWVIIKNQSFFPFSLLIIYMQIMQINCQYGRGWWWWGMGSPPHTHTLIKIFIRFTHHYLPPPPPPHNQQNQQHNMPSFSTLSSPISSLIIFPFLVKISVHLAHHTEKELTPALLLPPAVVQISTEIHTSRLNTFCYQKLVDPLMQTSH